MDRLVAGVSCAAFAVAALAPLDAEAGCTTGGVGVLPVAGTALPTNGRIVLHGTGVYMQSVASIASRTPHFVSQHDDVPLRVESLLVGAWAAASGVEAVLVPERELVDGDEYTVKLSPPNPHDLLEETPTHHWYFQRTMTWQVAGHVGPNAVRWMARPRRKRDVERTSCPYSLVTVLDTRVTRPDSLLAILVEARAAGSSSVQRFLVAPYQGELSLGHLGCETPIDLEPGVRTRLTLTAIDLAGHEVPGGTVVVVGPTGSR